MAQKQKTKIQTEVNTLRQSVRAADDEAQKTRLRAVLSVKEGLTQTDAAKRFVVSRVTIWSWIKTYEAGGAGALKMSKGGRPRGNSKWDTTLFESLAAEIDKGGKYWSVPLMCEWIKEKFQKDIPENTVWYRVKNLDYSYKSARPHPYPGDTTKQAAFKKGVSTHSTRSRKT